MAELTPADIAAVNGGRNQNDFDEVVLLVILMMMFGGNGFGWGRNNGAVTQMELQNGFDTQSILRGIDGVKNGLCDGFYAQNTTMLQGFNGLGREVLENRFEASKCCCETNRNIDAVRYEAAQNTCAITTNATANTQKILDKLCSMELSAKDQKIADLTAQNTTQAFQLSQQAQNATLINTLRPTPIPAYPTCSPYQAANYFNGFNGCGGCGGCGCGNFA